MRLATLLAAALLLACGDECFSPSDPPGSYEDAQDTDGCACREGVDEDVCVNSVALICDGPRWRAAVDGPCLARDPCPAPNPAGCSAEPCAEGFVCDTRLEAGCAPTGCVCDPGSGWTCTADCSGGVCVPAG